MAVLAYGADHYPAWRTELSWAELPLGGFGENLSVSGATEESVCIGDVWRAGTAVLEVSSPRKPCVKISRYWGRPDLLEQVQRSGRTGWYLRVLEEGEVQRGAAVALLDRPHAAWPVARAYRAALARRGEPETALALAEVAALSDRWKAWLRGEPARV
jgi:MOSC domain-containing protein YiiM